MNPIEPIQFLQDFFNSILFIGNISPNFRKRVLLCYREANRENQIFGDCDRSSELCLTDRPTLLKHPLTSEV
jgi:hypothetical protein